MTSTYTIQPYLRKGALTILVGILLFTAIPRTSPAYAESVAAVSQETTQFPVSGDREPTREMWVVATAYSSDPSQTDATPCTPAMGSFDMCANYEEHGIENTIATNMLPLGTQVRFPDLYGDKVFVVRDRMNSRYNGTNRIDFWVGSPAPTSPEIIAMAKNKARGFGVKRIRMEIYSK